MEKKVRLIPDVQRVLVSVDSHQQSKTKSGIIIPATSKEGKPETGIVVVTGKGDIDTPMRYKKGDKVLFSNYAGIELELNYEGLDNNKFKIMNQMDIMGLIEEVEEENNG